MKSKSISLLLINQYSFIAFGLIILVIITVSGWYSIGITYTIIVAGLALALLIASQLLLSTRIRPYSSMEAFDKSRTSGQPVLLILYSDFWIACLSIKPIVNRLESNLKDHFLMVRVSISSDLGQYLRTKYQCGIVPAVVLFDKHRNAVWTQSGRVPSSKTILSLGL